MKLKTNVTKNFQPKPLFFRSLLALNFLFYGFLVQAQTTLPDKAIQVIGGYSGHGSGDLKGLVFGTEYIQYVSKRFSLNYNFRGTINDGKDIILVNNNATGQHTDASVRFTTAGVQVGANGRISLIRNPVHEFLVSLGVYGRYQSASNGSDGYAIYYPNTTGQPTALIGYNNKTPQRTYSLGGIFQFQYNYTFRNNVYVGLTPGFQTDTNGDAITQIALAIGKRF